MTIADKFYGTHDDGTPSPADPAVCIAEAAKEAIDMALSAVTSSERDNQLLRAIQQITYLRSY
jgi:hypothetical protein